MPRLKNQPRTQPGPLSRLSVVGVGVSSVGLAAPVPVPAPPEQLAQLAEMERALKTARDEQQATMKELELSRQEQRIATDKALWVNAQYQSTNKELLRSKEELQSLNQELTALNNQLQETLDRQRTLGDDLQNILYSTDVATLFLDLDCASASSPQQRNRSSR